MKVYNLNEITDSRVLYDKKPPAFMKYIIVILVLLLGLSIIWANKSIKAYIVKGNGLVVSENKSYIMVKTSGEIKEVLVKEGSYVSEGDVLFLIDSLESDIQVQQLETEISTVTKRIELLKRAEENARKESNDFDKNNELENEFYNKLKAAYSGRKEFDVNENSLRVLGYNDQEIEEYKNAQKNKTEEHYYNVIAEFITERNQYEEQLVKLESQKEALDKNREKYYVTAKKSGVVHLDSSLTKGMVLQGGTLVGSITGKDEEMIVETMVTSTDRPRIHLGDEVSLVVGGLNQVEYGTVSGSVISIDEDATIDSEKGTTSFKVKVKPEQTYLEDSKGERVNLTIGMVTETRVKYEKITYMNYFLEMIGYKFK